ncbi:DUF2795 domain-containing protein [Streptomyces sp. NPDC029526]|uniref:DUF2795 domain-containing protein n=1 Tax=Streptomyces sp. NPDC029526 TaxID=3155728 RepID=UPI0033EC4739
MADPNPIDLQKALSGINYPAEKSALVDRARQNNADDAIVSRLDGLKDHSYGGPDEVQKAVFSG